MSAELHITVFCSSSDSVDPIFLQSADDLGRAIAGQKWNLVYGGNRLGMMKRLADSARASGARVIGITPQHFVDDGHGDDLCHELIVTPDMRQRKLLLEQRADAIIVMPGGIGTLEEFFEVLVAKALGHHAKPLVLLNIADYFAPLLAMLDHGIDAHFVRPKTKSLFFVAPAVDKAITYLQSSCPPATNPI